MQSLPQHAQKRAGDKRPAFYLPPPTHSAGDWRAYCDKVRLSPLASSAKEESGLPRLRLPNDEPRLDPTRQENPAETSTGL